MDDTMEDNEQATEETVSQIMAEFFASPLEGKPTIGLLQSLADTSGHVTTLTLTIEPNTGVYSMRLVFGPQEEGNAASSPHIQ